MNNSNLSLTNNNNNSNKNKTSFSGSSACLIKRDNSHIKSFGLGLAKAGITTGAVVGGYMAGSYIANAIENPILANIAKFGVTAVGAVAANLVCNQIDKTMDYTTSTVAEVHLEYNTAIMKAAGLSDDQVKQLVDMASGEAQQLIEQNDQVVNQQQQSNGVIPQEIVDQCAKQMMGINSVIQETGIDVETTEIIVKGKDASGRVQKLTFPID